jgi:hypothetical protein
MKKFIFTFLAFVFIFSSGLSSSFAQSLDIKASEKITAEVNGLNTPDATLITQKNYKEIGDIAIGQIGNQSKDVLFYRSSGCSYGCSSGCSVGCSVGCSMGCR